MLIDPYLEDHLSEELKLIVLLMDMEDMMLQMIQNLVGFGPVMIKNSILIT